MQPPPDNFLMTLYAPVGELFISFALLESLVTQLVAIAHRLPNGSAIKKKIPHQFGEKTLFMEQAFSALPELAPFKADGLAIIAEAAPIASLRNQIVHGALSETDEAAGVMTFVKLDIDKAGNIYKQNERSVSFQEILNVSGECSALVARSIVLQKRMLEKLHGIRV